MSDSTFAAGTVYCHRKISVKWRLSWTTSKDTTWSFASVVESFCAVRTQKPCQKFMRMPWRHWHLSNTNTNSVDSIHGQQWVDVFRLSGQFSALRLVSSLFFSTPKVWVTCLLWVNVLRSVCILGNVWTLTTLFWPQMITVAVVMVTIVVLAASSLHVVAGDISHVVFFRE